jgi:pimeloyl-ACP methyl ester carboxylesterase
MEASYHPFRSQHAKETYLALYDEQVKKWPVPSENRMVNTSFGQTYVRISGSGDGHPLVLLPGDSENSLNWIPQIKAFSEDYRTYALDHIYDNGRSIFKQPMKKPGDFVTWLDELFTVLDLQDINLMGFSYGGWQASLYALAFPTRLNTLILLAPAATVLPGRFEVFIRAMLYFFIHTPSIVRNYYYWYSADSVKQETTRKIIDDMITENLLAKQCFKSRKFVIPTVLSDEEWQALHVPTLFLTGEHEVTYSAHKAIRRLNRIAPHVKTVITSDAGHDLAIVKSEWVNNEVLQFLNSQQKR